MDDLKQRFLGFVKKQGHARSPLTSPSTEAASRPCDDYSLPTTRSRDTVRRSIDIQPLADEEILESVDPIYLSGEQFDPCKHELKNLPKLLDSMAIQEDYKKLRQQHNVISKKVLQLILQKQTPCNEEFERRDLYPLNPCKSYLPMAIPLCCPVSSIATNATLRVIELQDKLVLSLRICREGRACLNLGKEQLTTASLGILANYRKRQLVQGILHSLNTIKTLQRTDERLQELLNEENYQGAIALLLECQSAAFNYRHFNCVAALSGKLQDTLVMAEEQLDKALSKVCNRFDGEHYSKVQAGYSLLGKTQMAMDQLHMHFSTTIHNTAFNIVHGYVELCSKPALAEDKEVPLHKKQFKQLCASVTSESFIPCLVDLCKALWEIMKSYKHVMAWHAMNPETSSPGLRGATGDDFEAQVNEQYISQKLDNGLLRIWHDVQARVSVYLLGSDLAWYKFEEILEVLGIVHRLMEVGEEFCGSKSEELLNSIRQQSGNYFKNYHRARLDEIRIFLENDGWEICPVKPSFTLLQLQEFKTLRHVLRSWKPKETTVSSPDCGSSNHSQDGSSVAGGFFVKYAESGSPFDVGLDETQDEDILANIGDEPSGYYSEDSDEDIPEELKRDFVDENVGDSVPANKHSKTIHKRDVERQLKAPIVTNTTLTVLRQCGKYLQMSRLLRPIASEVIAGMSQLFEFYLYAVHSFFAADLPVPTHSLHSLKLQATLKRIEDSLILPERLDGYESESHPSKLSDKLHRPYLSPVVDLKWTEKLYGLAERIVAVESTIFLAKQFEILHGYLEHLIPPSNKHFVQQFYTQTIGVITELRQPVYMCVSFRAIDTRTILSLMGKVNWEVREVISQHSQYVDILLRELQLFSKRFEDTATKIPISRDVYTCLWENVIKIASNTFVEGFSHAKKCSNGGRGLMQLDFIQFISKLEKLTSLRPIPYREQVEVYVKAFYLPETALENWIRDHSEYSCKQLIGLVSCVCQKNKKSRQRLIAVIEDMDKFAR